VSQGRRNGEGVLEKEAVGFRRRKHLDFPGLIALVHVAAGMKGVSNVAEFLNPILVPSRRVRVAVFDGENADPANGRPIGDLIRAYTPWGEIAYQLAGKTGYEVVRRSDEQRIAPGADTLKELFRDRRGRWRQ
jgi:hypothetical protein